MATRRWPPCSWTGAPKATSTPRTRDARRPCITRRISYLNSNPEVATLLMQRGADIHARDNAGKTPCQLARSRGKFTGHPVQDVLCAPKSLS